MFFRCVLKRLLYGEKPREFSQPTLSSSATIYYRRATVAHISPAIIILGLEECFADFLPSSCDASSQLFMMMIVCPITVIELMGPGRYQQMTWLAV